MKIIAIIETGLSPNEAQALENVKTQNRKEVMGPVVFFKDITPDTLPADIRAIGREVDYINRTRQLASTLSMMHISGDLDRLINRLAKGTVLPI